MRHVTLPDRSLLIGDRAADLLLAYAALIAQMGRGDHDLLRAIGGDGVEIDAGFLLNSGTSLLVESSTSSIPEPDNAAGIAYLQGRLESFGLDGQDDPHPFAAEDDSSSTGAL
jgi:hypothetical protein